MQSSDDVKLSDRLTVSRSCGLESLLERHGIGAGRIFLAAEGAEAAGRYTDVGGVDVAIHVEIRLVAMHALADVVSHPAHGENVAGAVEGEGVVRVEALAVHDFAVDRLQARVVGLKRVKRRHLPDDIAGV